MQAVVTTEQEVVYRRASKLQMILGTMNTGASMCFFMLMTYASYIGSAGYGVATALVGLIMTGTRIFDGITDPIIALWIDKTNTRFGKIRLWLLSGWVVESTAVFLLINVLSEKGFGVGMYILIYCLYVIGYTMNNIAGNIIPPVMVTDPKQRPMVGVFSTVYSYIIPMIVMLVINIVILPRYNNQYSVPMLQATSVAMIALSFVFMILACIGITKVDIPENFNGTASQEKEKIHVRDMFHIIRSSKALQLYIVALASDKFAQQTAGQAIIGTMLSGILIGNMQIATQISVYAMLPSILFAFMGAKYAGKHGARKAMLDWSWIYVVVLAAMYLWLSLFDMRLISASVVWMVIYTVTSLVRNATMMSLTTANNMMLSDIIDYEHARTGKYLPAAITGTYMFVDKFISAFGSTLATIAVAMIGYTSTLPQPNDEPTVSIKLLTLFLTFGLPLIARLIAILAIKHSPVTKESLVEAHQKIQASKGEI